MELRVGNNEYLSAANYATITNHFLQVGSRELLQGAIAGGSQGAIAGDS